MLIPIKVPPGVYRNETELTSAGRWYDSNLVRWYQDAMQPMGGWAKLNDSAVTGRASGVYTWRQNDLTRWLAVGTEQKLYAYRAGQTQFDITPTGYSTGRASAEDFLGYGGQYYGTFNYGVARPDNSLTGILPATAWSLDNFGEVLIACANTDGVIYSWDLNTSNPAAAVHGSAPTSNQAIVVTEERFLFALGADGDPRKIAWADQESLTTWSSSPTNQAGDFNLQTTGSIVAGCRVKGSTLIFTTSDVHVAQYLGPPYVYGFQRAGISCGLIAINAVISFDVGAVWMSDSGFWMYDGYAKPLNCEVADYVFRDMNFNQKSKISALHNAEFGEVMWLYPSANSTENDRYVVWNYRENHWSIGAMDRTVGVHANIFRTPIMIGTDGYVYEHETGWDYDGASPYVESGPMQLGNGDNVMCATQLIPDERTAGDVQVKFKTRFYPNGDEQTFGPYSMSSPTDVRFTARQAKMRIEPIKNTAWRVGEMRIDASPGGKR